MEQPTDWQIFVSYSHLNAWIVKPLTQLIRVTGVSTFRDEDSIRPGKQWRMVIANSLESCTTLLLFWSKAASESAQVREEWQAAMRLGKDIVPVLIDETAVDEVLSRYQWINLIGVGQGPVRAIAPGFVRSLQIAFRRAFLGRPHKMSTPTEDLSPTMGDTLYFMKQLDRRLMDGFTG